MLSVQNIILYHTLSRPTNAPLSLYAIIIDTVPRWWSVYQNNRNSSSHLVRCEKCSQITRNHGKETKSRRSTSCFPVLARSLPYYPPRTKLPLWRGMRGNTLIADGLVDQILACGGAISENKHYVNVQRTAGKLLTFFQRVVKLPYESCRATIRRTVPRQAPASEKPSRKHSWWNIFHGRSSRASSAAHFPWVIAEYLI